MIRYVNDKEHLVLMPINITKEKFLKRAKVLRGSYFFRLLDSIYVALTEPSVDLEIEHQTYYNEYVSFKEFLNKKFPSLDDEEIEIVLSKLETKKYRLLKGSMSKHNDYVQLSLFDTDENFKSIIEKLLQEELYED